jgi:hypothetical protein
VTAWPRTQIVLIASRDGNRLLGTGTVITKGRVLTARHVVFGKNGAKAELCIGDPSDRASAPATILWSGPEILDVAVLEAEVSAELDLRASLSTRDLSTGEVWEARGYPKVRAVESSERLEVITGTTVSYAANDPFLSLDAHVRPDEWGGLSGAAVVVKGHLVGVVRAIPTGWSGGRMEATPVAAFLTHPSFREAVGLAPPTPLPGALSLRSKHSFVGRDDELAALATLLLEAATGPRVAVITGLGGTGKTTLARRFASDHANDFAGGLLQADLEAHNPDYAVRRALEYWESQLGGQFIPDRPIHVLLGTVQRLVAIRTATVGAVLVILDNVDSSEPLVVLDALVDCAVLVTTRKRAIADERNLPVVALSDFDRAATHAYFTSILGANDPRARDIEALLEHDETLPLTLTVLAAMLKGNQTLRPDFVLASLQSRSSTLGADSLPAALALSIERLPRGPLLPILVATASLSAVSWPAAALDYIAGVSDLRATREALTKLEHLRLVEALGDDRYKVHRRIADYLRQTYGKRGFGRIPVTSELSSLPWFLMRLHLWKSAGFAAYDLREETYFLRTARQLDESAQGLPTEWDNLALAIRRRAVTGREYSLRTQLELFSKLLRGADLSGLSLQRVPLDGIALDHARLEEADLSSPPLRRWPTAKEIQAWLPRTLIETALAVAVFEIAYQLIANSLGGTMERKSWLLALLGAAVVVPERIGNAPL